MLPCGHNGHNGVPFNLTISPMEDIMKLVNNLCKLLNKQFLETKSNYYPYFSKGELCIDSIQSHISTSCYVIKKVARNRYTIYWVSDISHIKDIYSPHVIATWGNKTEQEVVALFKNN